MDPTLVFNLAAAACSIEIARDSVSTDDDFCQLWNKLIAIQNEIEAVIKEVVASPPPSSEKVSAP